MERESMLLHREQRNMGNGKKGRGSDGLGETKETALEKKQLIRNIDF